MSHPSPTSTAPSDRSAAITAPGVLLGVGLGGFVDGILLHQVLQWHHLLSSTDSDHVGLPTFPVTTVRGLEVNTLADGLFHVVSWLAVLAGVSLLYARLRHPRSWAWRSPALWGPVLMGWGLFNLVEGIVDHHLLGIHHVRSGPHETWYDVGFLVFGLLLVGAGRLVGRRAQEA